MSKLSDKILRLVKVSEDGYQVCNLSNIADMIEENDKFKDKVESLKLIAETWKEVAEEGLDGWKDERDKLKSRITELELNLFKEENRGGDKGIENRGDNLPQMEDLHGIDITGGVKSEDYIRKMRGGE